MTSQATQQANDAPDTGADASHLHTAQVSRYGSIGHSIFSLLTRPPVFLLILAFLFMLPGMPPFRVAAPMDQLLIFPPWSELYPEAVTRLRGSDVLFQQLPWHHWMQDELLAGRFPLWVSAPLGGYPLFAYYQAGVLFPLHLLWALLPTGAGFGPILALKIWLAGWGMWLFLRALNLHWSASLLGALGFMFCAGLIVWLPWSHTNSYILLPWLCLTAYEWCQNRRKGALAGFAFLWACALVGGSPEFFFIVAVCVGIWMAGLVLSSKPKLWGWQVGGLAVAVVVGTLMGAIQLLPFFESLGLSYITNIRPVDVEAAIVRARSHLDVGTMYNWIVPRWWGQVYDGVLAGTHLPNESNAYVGQVALLGLPLLVVGLFRRKINLRFAIPFALVGILCWIVAYDDEFGILVRRLPGFSQMVNLRFILGIAFAVLVLGALGWDWLARSLEQRKVAAQQQPLEDTAQPAKPQRTTLNPMSVVGIGLAVVSAAYLLAHWLGLVPKPDVGMRPGMPVLGVLFPPNTDYRLHWISWQVAVLLGIFGAILYWWANRRAERGDIPSTEQALTQKIPQTAIRNPQFLAPILIGIFLVADLWQFLYTFNQTSPADWYYPRTSFIEQVVAIVPPTERFVAEGEALLTHTGLIYGMRDWRAQDPMITSRANRSSVLLDPDYRSDPWNRYNMVFHDMRLQVAPLFGVRYFVFPNDMDPNNPASPDPGRPGFKRLAFTEGLGLWEVEGVPGFSYLSDNITVMPDENSARTWMSTVTWEQTRQYIALVEAAPDKLAAVQRAPDGASPGSVLVTTYTPGHIRLEVDAQRAALLVVSESYYPGWNARMDGAPVEILRANYLSQGIIVPAGKHTIEMRYEPDSFRNGALLSFVGLAGLAGLMVWDRRGARRA